MPAARIRTRRALLLTLALTACARAQTSVRTYHYDNARTGANTSETVLSPSTVSPTSFGKLFTLATDGQVYAQPLYIPGVAIPGKGTHNVVYVCTMHDSVYAFDADDASGPNAQPLWKVALAPGLGSDGTGVTPVPAGDVGNGYGDIQVEIGIVSTPVIDTATGTLYTVAKTREITGAPGSLVTRYVQRLHALDIATGAERFGGPVEIAASVPGTGYAGAYGTFDGNAGSVSFDARNELQRSGLLLSSGKVYIAWAAHEDHDAYHGWLLGYQAGDLSAAPSVFCASPNGGRSGVWQGGVAPAADADGSIYLETGNGSVNPAIDNYGDAVVRLGAGLGVTDYFIPHNQAQLDLGDVDLGCTGPLILPDQTTGPPHLMVASGKEGQIYLLDRDHLGGYGAVDEVVQAVQGAAYGRGPRGGAAFWNGRLYYAIYSDHLKCWTLTGGLLSAVPVSQTPDTFGYLGATPTVSANGNDGGVVWAVEIGAYGSGGPAVLRAYDAMDLSRVLYASDQTGGRDTLGPAIKFTVPVVVNGKVYVGTGAGVSAFGPIPDTTPLTLASAGATQQYRVAAAFNRPVDPATGSDPAHFAIDGGVAVTGAAPSADGRTVTLTTGALTPGITYTLTVTGLQDTAVPPHTIADGSTASFQYTPLSGDGLLGEYFANTRILAGSPALTRLDATVDFDWGTGAPDPAVGADNFSVRWTGYVQPVTTGLYTFTATSDDGVRLWVDNRSLLPSNSWSDHSPTDFSGAISLSAGQRYPIRMEMYENGGGAVARLAWAGPGVPLQVVPQRNLYSRGTAYTFDDVRHALGLAGGLSGAGTADAARLDVEATPPSAGVVDVMDVARLLRKVYGVDPNP